MHEKLAKFNLALINDPKNATVLLGLGSETYIHDDNPADMQSIRNRYSEYEMALQDLVASFGLLSEGIDDAAKKVIEFEVKNSDAAKFALQAIGFVVGKVNDLIKSSPEAVELIDSVHDELDIKGATAVAYLNGSTIKGALWNIDDYPNQQEAYESKGFLFLMGTVVTSGASTVVDAAAGAVAVIKPGVKRLNERGTPNATNSGTELIPSLSRPVRLPNANFPPDAAVVDAMGNQKVQEMILNTGGTVCSDIAAKLQSAAAGRGNILEVRPAARGNLNVYENGQVVPKQYYHQVYTDGKYVYDPRVLQTPIPKGDWLQHINNINPDGITITDTLRGLK